MNDGAYGMEPLDISKGKESKIRMEKEHLTFQCGKKYTQVTAVFHFKNTDPHSAVTQLWGYPDEALGMDPRDKEPLEQGVAGILEGLKTRVEGQPVSAPVRFGYVEMTEKGYWVPTNRKNGKKIGWYTFPLVLPPGGEKTVEVSYKTKNGYYEYEPPYYFKYILFTGATWKGTIGELVADVKLTDGLKVTDLYWPHFPEKILHFDIMTPGKENWKVIDDHDLQLVLSDFKPKEPKSPQEIVISSLSGAVRETDKWEVQDYEKYAVAEGYEMICRYGEVYDSYLEVSTPILMKATGGHHLADVLKPGDVIEYTGTRLANETVRVVDPQKDVFRIVKKK